jgi:hypothetical protein
LPLAHFASTIIAGWFGKDVSDTFWYSDTSPYFE